MGDVLRRCVEGAQQIGAVGVFLDSLDDKSTAFYRKLGFVDILHEPLNSPDGPQPMFLPMQILAEAVRGSSQIDAGWMPSRSLARR